MEWKGSCFTRHDLSCFFGIELSIEFVFLQINKPRQSRGIQLCNSYSGCGSRSFLVGFLWDFLLESDDSLLNQILAWTSGYRLLENGGMVWRSESIRFVFRKMQVSQKYLSFGP